MATSLRGISSTACREDLGAMIRRLALSPFGYFVRRPVLGPDQPMAELLCLRVVLLSLDASLARDGQPVDRIFTRLNS